MPITLNGTTGITTPGIDSSGNPVLSGGTANGVAYANASKVLTTGTSLVFDGTNLGVGTSNPQYKFVVSNAGAAGVEIGASSVGVIQAYNRSGAAFVNLNQYALGFTFNSGASVNNTLTYDSAGNLGLGVTPSAWSSGKAIEVGNKGNSLWGPGSNEIVLAANAYYASGWKYAASTSASYYYQYAGAHSWYTAPSGTAGNAISFTQAMTLDASSNLAVNGNITIADTKNLYMGVGSEQRIFAGGASGSTYLTFSQWTGSAYTERARIDSSGNLLVGTTSALPGGLTGLHINTATAGTTYGIGGASKAYFYMSTSTTSRWETITGVTIQVASGNTNGVSLANGGTSWGTLSDERKKDIIEPITGAAEKISSLRAVIGKYKTDEDGTRRAFLIAQDVQAVLPEAVVENDGDLILQYTETIPLLVAAIQELNAKVEAQATEIAALKGAA